MKRLDLLTPIGIVVGVLVLIFGVLSNGASGGFLSFLDIPSMIILFGGLAAAMLVNFSIKELKRLPSVIKQGFSIKDHSLKDLIETCILLSDRARREGLLALEMELDEVKDPFLKKGILLAIDGIESDTITDIMHADIRAMEERHGRMRNLLEKAGDYAPAWGMIGTLIGLVLMLKNLNDPSTLGPNMAIALLTTLYGSLLANLFFHPLAAKLLAQTDEEVFYKQIVIEGVIGVQSGQNPKLLKEKLAVFLSDEDQKEEEDKDKVSPFSEETVRNEL
ncbi:flagellar motor protein MotP [Bacillus fonticola]|uniref:flagellar motor protein MotP n=1 Tax=Bacillus fonticola TaxID=2728853 RepID=UPI001474F94A|nr:flagellar motor protein MotP [Bacillus fonticola]